MQDFKPIRVDVAPDLEQQTLAKFDRLLSEDQIVFENTPVEVLTDGGFRFEYRVIPGFQKKPILGANDPGRARAQKGPFLPPNPEELVCQAGKTHNVIINKYATHRPMLVIPTQNFRQQTEDLDLDDLSVATALLEAFKAASVVIYNCGVESGSSQGHKHLQLFPASVEELWPSKAATQGDGKARLSREGGWGRMGADAGKGIITTAKDVPFKHFLVRIQPGWTVYEVYNEYAKCVRLAREALRACRSASNDYNVCMSRDWIVVIPRRTAGPEGPFGSNAAGMLGMVSVPNQAQRDMWTRLGHAKYLTELGVPLDQESK